MAKPIINWVDKDLNPLTELVLLKDGGAVTADTESDHVQLYITNNFTKGTATADAVYAATQCQLKVMATDGTINSPVVKEKWFNAKCISGSDADFTSLGGVDAENTVSLTVTSGDPTKAATISGDANDGTVTGTGQYNAALIETFVKPALNTQAEGGDQAFTIVLTYSYGAE